LFAGIGGFDLGFERAGMVCKWQVEIDDYANRVLAKHWPRVHRERDVRTVGRHNLESVDVICGGFPCQDIAVSSSTGTGLDGERSGLWAEYKRLIRVLRPRFVVVENSANLLNRGFGRVLRDLASSGYDAEWRVFSAYEFGAPHKRERLYVVAYANKEYGATRLGAEQNRTPKIFGSGPDARVDVWLQATSEFAGMDDGISSRSYRDRVGCVGNAVVPQVAEWIGQRIVESFKEFQS
jgi:DNA (cytosine-5)-methyltransferase 1